MLGRFVKSGQRLHRRRAFTLVELMVVVAIIGLLIALLLPAVQAARETGRRAQCMNNLKQIGLGVQQYQAAHRAFPPGAVAFVNFQYSGYNFVYWCLPYMEGQAYFDAAEKGLKNSELGNMVANPILRYHFSDKSIPWAICPSSPMPAWHEGQPYGFGTIPPLARLQCLDYAACSGSYVGTHYSQDDVNPVRKRAYSGLMPMYWKEGWSPPHGTYGGSSKGKYGVKLREVTDGISKTIAIVETSGLLFEGDVIPKPGRMTDRGFIEGPCCNYNSVGERGTTTIILPVGTVNKLAVDAVGGAPPITSGHGPAGNVVFGDGSVHFLHEDIDVKLLYALADRNDNRVIESNSIP